MNNHHLTKKTAAAIFAATLAFGSPVWAETAANTAASAGAVSAVKHFPDVTASHWANKYITRLSLQGIVVGNEKGEYEPEESVTQEQVITMAIRMMGLEPELASLPAANVGFELSDYAKPYVQMALEKGLIDFQEEKTLSGLSQWGTKKATREWVAKLAVRAIGKQDEATKLGDQTPPFTDNASISVWAKGFINEAVALKIVDGMEDGSFKPQDPVTRAQMAAFLSRAGKYMPDIPSKTVTGYVESVTSSAIVLTDDYGTKTSYPISAGTAIFGTGVNAIKAAELKTDSKVFLILSQGAAQYAEVLEDQAQSPNRIKGTVIEIQTGDSGLQLRLKTSAGESTVDLDNHLTILDANGKGMKLSDLVEGVSVELRRTGILSKFTNITIVHIPVNKTAEGTVQSLDAANGILNVTEKDAGAVQYPLADEVTYINNGVQGDLSTLRQGDGIRYNIEDGKVTRIEMVTPYVEPSDSGKLLDYRVDKDHTVITIQKADNQYASYSVQAQPDVVIPGMDYASYKDLLPGDTVKVMLTDNKSVYKIVVTNRSMATEYFDTVVSYDADSKLLTVKTADGLARVYELSDSTGFDVGGTTVQLSSASYFLTKGKKVDVTSSSESQVKQVHAVTGYQGTVVRTNASSGEMTMKVGNELITMKVNAGVAMEIPFKTGGSFSDLNIGDKVNITYDSYTDSVIKIQLAQTVVYRLVDKDVTAKSLTFKNSSGSSFTLAVGTGIKLYNQYQTEVGVADLTVDDLYNVAYNGSTVGSVTAAVTTKGVLSSVDLAAGKLSYTDSNGAVQTLQVGTDAKVKREGSDSMTPLSDLKPGDHIETSKNSDGKYTIWAAKVLNRSIDYYDSYSKLLYVYRATLDEARYYSLSSNVNIHKGTATLQVTDLKRDDKANLYVMDGKIVEIEVQ